MTKTARSMSVLTTPTSAKLVAFISMAGVSQRPEGGWGNPCQPLSTARLYATGLCPCYINAAMTPQTNTAGLSIVVPIYNEAAGLSSLHARISDVARRLKDKRGLRCEVVYVDDGSRDATLAIARELPAAALDVQVVSLSRNFGKEAALLAGLEHARLGAIMFMDGDGQHPPDLVDTLVRYWLEDGYDVVYTAKAHRAAEPFTRRFA